MFEQTFKNIDDVLWKGAGCATELDYTEQTSWLLFLKYLDDLEQSRAINASFAGKAFDFILDTPYQWSRWAAPRDHDGNLDRDRALTGDDLLDFVNRELFPYLQGFRERASGPDTIEYKIGERIYDGAAGSAGFLCEAHDYLRYGFNSDEPHALTTEQLKEIGRLVDAEHSDLFDVLAYIAFALPPLSREERVAAHRERLLSGYDYRQREFLGFVLGHYIQDGVGELAEDKLPRLIELKYRTPTDAIAELGSVEHIREVFIGFQERLYG